MIRWKPSFTNDSYDHKHVVSTTQNLQDSEHAKCTITQSSYLLMHVELPEDLCSIKEVLIIEYSVLLFSPSSIFNTTSASMLLVLFSVPCQQR